MGKKALVTGGSRGIGRGIALALAEAGYELCIAHHGDGERAEATAELVRGLSGSACAVLEADLREPQAPIRLAEEAFQALGRLDVLVNNAGFGIFEPIQRLTASRLDDMLGLNFRSPLVLMQLVSDRMIADGTRGSIVNVTSTRAARAYPGDAAYGGLKAGLQRASESAALDLAPYGIRVNCVAPGATLVRDEDERTRELGKRIPLGRMGQPDDIGRAVVWLVSDSAAYMTGATLKLDGGLSLPGMPEDGRSYWGAAKKEF